MTTRLLNTQRIVNIADDPATGSAGEIYYNSTQNVLRYHDGTQWTNFYASTLKHLVKNDSGVTLPKGTVVYTSGANGSNILIKPASNLTDPVSAQTLGFLETTLSPNGQGYAINNGLITGIDTEAANAGDPVWLSASAGLVIYGFANEPKAPNHLVYLGVVTRSNKNNGEIFVHISNGWELDELHNVRITSASANHIINYNAASALWVNENLATVIQRVDGAGSGIDADLLDGQDGAYYLNTSSTAQTKTGALSVDNTITAKANVKVNGAVAGNVANLIMTRTDTSWRISNETSLRMYYGAGDTDSPSNVSLELGNDGQIRSGIDGTAAAPSFSRSTDLNTGIFFPTADALAFTAGGVQRARIDSTGLGVGINPSFNLHVSSSSNTEGRISTTSSTGYAGLGITGSVTNKNIYMLSYSASASGTSFGLSRADTGTVCSNNQPLILGTMDSFNLTLGTANTARMTIDTSGRVGIGTNNPTELLMLTSSAPKILFSPSGAGGPDIFLGADNGSGSIAASKFFIGQSSTAYLTINTVTSGAAGRVGIGTTNPSSLLHINNSASATIGMIVQGATGQSANLQEWRNVGGTVISRVNSSGGIYVNGSSVQQVGLHADGAGAQFRFGTTTNATEYATLGAINNAIEFSVADRPFRFLRINDGVLVQIRGMATQTANLQEWQSSAGSVLASISASGSLSITGNLSVTGTSNIQGRNTASDTAPTSPRVGDGWYDTNTGKQYVWYDSFWVEESSVSNAATVQLGTVTTIDAAAQATVTNSGTAQNAVLNFRIPRGQMGAAPLFYATFYG